MRAKLACSRFVSKKFESLLYEIACIIPRSSLLFQERQRKPEGRTLARRALHPGLPSVQANQLLTNIEAQAQTTAVYTFISCEAGCLAKALPDIALRICGNTRTAIFDPDPRLVVLCLNTNSD